MGNRVMTELITERARICQRFVRNRSHTVLAGRRYRRSLMVGGRFVVRDRKLVNVDERELVLRGRAAASRLWERMQGYT